MSPGAVEKGIDTVAAAVQALRASPMILALVILQAFTMAGITWSINQRAKYMSEERRLFSDERKMIYERCVPDVDRPRKLGDQPQ